MSFYQSSQPLVIPETITAGVQTLTAGSNVSLTGTSVNPIINAVSPIAALTAGSNITLSGTSNITINSASPIEALTAGSNIDITGTAANPVVNVTGLTSAANINYHGSKTATLAASVLSNAFVSLFTIADTYFANSNSSYLLSANYHITDATCSNVTGGVGIQVNYANFDTIGLSYMYLTNQSTWSNADNVANQASLAATFIPTVAGSNLSFLFVNNTNGTFSNATIVFNNISITGLTTSNVSANNFP